VALVRADQPATFERHAPWSTWTRRLLPGGQSRWLRHTSVLTHVGQHCHRLGVDLADPCHWGCPLRWAGLRITRLTGLGTTIGEQPRETSRSLSPPASWRAHR